jgi:hypothetical protein
MVKEMGVIKTLVISYMNSQNTVEGNMESFQQPFRQNIVLTPSNYETEIHLDALPVENLMQESFPDEEDDEDDEEDDDEDEEDEDEEDEEDDDEEDEEDDDEDEEDDDEEEDVNITKPFIETLYEPKIAVSDDEDENVHVHQRDTEFIEVEMTEIDTTDNEIVLAESTLEEQLTQLDLTSEKVLEEISVPQIVDETNKIDKNEKKEDYSKYTLAQLKDLVIEKGLTKDTSKMKKPKLLELLSTTA